MMQNRRLKATTKKGVQSSSFCVQFAVCNCLMRTEILLPFPPQLPHESSSIWCLRDSAQIGDRIEFCRKHYVFVKLQYFGIENACHFHFIAQFGMHVSEYFVWIFDIVNALGEQTSSHIFVWSKRS